MVIGSVKEFMADWGLLNTQDMSSKFYFIVSLLWVNQTILWCFLIHYIYITYITPMFYGTPWSDLVPSSSNILLLTTSPDDITDSDKGYFGLICRSHLKKTYPLINVQLCHHLFTIAFAMALVLMCRLCDMCIYEISW